MASGFFVTIHHLPTKLNKALSCTTSTSHQQDPPCSVREDLRKLSLSQMLAGIEAVQQDAKEREIRDCSVRLWLKELRGGGYLEEDVPDKFYYEVLRSIAQGGDAAIETYIGTGVIDIPITDGKIDTEKEIDIAASAFILRERSRLDHEIKIGAIETGIDLEMDINTAASAFIDSIRSRLDHENKTGTVKTDRKDINAAAEEFIRRVKSRFKSQP